MILNRPMVNWECPKCPVKVRKPLVPGHLEYHNCTGMKLLSIPFIREGERVKVTANEREDYVKDEMVQTDAEGRPVMNVIIEREDGTDCSVYAPTAILKREG